MQERTYNGAHPEVELVLPDGSVHSVKHGEAIEVPDEVAENLDQQENNWLGGPPKTEPATEDEPTGDEPTEPATEDEPTGETEIEEAA
jgi:hypothetical protein